MEYVLAYKMVGIFDNNCNCLVFFTQVNLNIKWKKIVEEIESLRQLAAFEKKQRLTMEAEKAGEGGSDKEVEVRKYEKKKKDPSPSAKEVWEDYPEFNPLEFIPEDDLLNYVRGDELLYTEPWWKMNSVSLYVLHGYGFAGFGFGFLSLFICLTALLLYMAHSGNVPLRGLEIPLILVFQGLKSLF